MERDVVCGMTVDPKTAEVKSEHEGKTYYFCCDGCKDSFEKDPGKYAGAQASAKSAIATRESDGCLVG